MTTEITMPDSVTIDDAVTTKLATLQDRAKALRIRSAASFAEGDTILVTCKALRKRIQSAFEPATERFREIKRQADAGRRDNEAKQAEYEQPVIEAESRVKELMQAYQTEQKQLAAAKQAEADAKAQADADARKAKEVEAMRAEAERVRKEDAAAAKELEAQAALTEEQPAAPVAAAPVAAAPKAGHSHSRTTYSADLVNMTHLCLAIGNPLCPMATANLVKLDAKAANQLARALKSNMSVPGLRLVKKDDWVQGR